MGYEHWLMPLATGLATVLATAPAALATAPAALVVPAASPVELDRLGGTSRQAAALAAEGEVALAAGDLPRAAERYRRASQSAPRSGFPARRLCEILTELGQREPALAACHLAVQYGATVLDARAAVGAMMLGDGPPALELVADATMMAAGARNLLPGQPYPYAAFADIARRIGDPPMMRANLAELERLAPGHPETLRARRLAPATHRGWRLTGWGLLLLAALAAGARTLRRLAPRSPASARLALLLLFCGGRALADEPLAPPEHLGDEAINDQDPSSQVPGPGKASANPVKFAYLLMDLATRAEEAEKRGQLDQAIKYYQALAKAVPDRSVSYGKICRAHELLGNRDAALTACRDAIAREGVRVDDYERYVRLLLDHPGAVTPADRADVLEIEAHLRKEPATQAGADDVKCQLGARSSDAVMLQDCVSRLTGSDARALSYRWALALEQHRFGEARALIGQARAAGLPTPVLAKMESITRSQQLRRRVPLWGGAALGIAGLVLFLRRGRKAA
jgi:tetratricopeptide (TPR) repeat protein